MSEYVFTFHGRLPGLNEYTKANRTNYRVGNQMKRDAQYSIEYIARAAFKGLRITVPVYIGIRYFEPNKKRDLDNISAFARKVILDALVCQGILSDDGWDEVLGFTEEFFCDRKDPRIEITIKEVNDESSKSKDANP